MRPRSASWLAGFALIALDATAAEQRSVTAMTVGAVVPAPSCIASVVQRGLLAVNCSNTVPFMAQAAALPPGTPWSTAPPSLSISLLSEAGPTAINGPLPRAPSSDDLLITVIY